MKLWRSQQMLIEALADAEDEMVRMEERLRNAARWIAKLEEAHLENLRAIQSLASTILLLRANPDLDVADEVEALLNDVSDQVAVIEEHLP